MEDNVQAAGKTITDNDRYSYKDVVISINGVVVNYTNNITQMSEAADEVSEDVCQSQ